MGGAGGGGVGGGGALGGGCQAGTGGWRRMSAYVGGQTGGIEGRG